jgi:hypothetical protein
MKATAKADNLKHNYTKTTTKLLVSEQEPEIRVMEADNKIHQAYGTKSAEDFRQDLFLKAQTSLENLNKRYAKKKIRE